MLLTPVPGETAPFASRVADFYRGKGYEVRQNARVRGASGNIYAVEMVAAGPLGALLVSFGDAAGVDGPEIGRARTLARDIGATPVIACPELSPELRHLAAQYGVVVVDLAALSDPAAIANVAPSIAPDPVVRDLDAHPWPASGRARPEVPAESARAVDVEDLFSGFGSPAGARRSDGDGLWSTTAPTNATPAAPSLPPAQPTAPGTAAREVSPGGGFSWLAGNATPDVERVVAPATPLTSSILGRTPVPAEGLHGAIGAPLPQPAAQPAVEHQAVLAARRPTVAERVEDFAREAAAPAALWKYAVGAAVGAALLFLAIRWMA